jgi:excisionase family DNA binding protein
MSKLWMTRAETADHLTVSLQTVDNFADAGLLIKHRLGRIVRFNRNEVDAAMGSQP